LRVTIDDKVPMRKTTMALEKGDRVIFSKDAGGILRPFVRKGTEGTVTKAGGWGIRHRGHTGERDEAHRLSG
jgi:hypothetical protein